MELRKKIITGAVVLVIGAGAYFAGSSMLDADRKYERLFEESNKSIVGIVLKKNDQNTFSPVPEKYISGLVSQAYSNETVKLESKLSLKIQTDDGRIIGVSIIDWGGLGTPVKKESLDVIIDSVEEVGIDNASRISFPAGNMRHGNWLVGGTKRDFPNETYFTHETQVGNKRADRIKVLSKK